MFKLRITTKTGLSETSHILFSVANIVVLLSLPGSTAFTASFLKRYTESSVMLLLRQSLKLHLTHEII